MKRFLLFSLLLVVSGFSFAQCTPGFTWTQTNPNEITFTNTTPFTPDSTFFYWTFGDNTWSTDQHPVKIYSGSGTFVVCLNVSDSTLHCSSTFCDTITVTGVPICNLALTVSEQQNTSCTNCSNGVASVGIVIGGVPPFTYLWSNGNTNQYCGGLDNGYVSVTVTDVNGCFVTDSAYISIGNFGPPDPYANFNDQHIGGDTIHFQNWSSYYTPTTNFYWDFGDASFDSVFSPNHYYAAPGTYTVCLTITDTVFQLIPDTYCDTVVINQPPPPPGCYPAIYILPQGNFAAYVMTLALGNYNGPFQWSWGDGNYDSLNPYPTHVYMNPGTYTICLTINDTANNCTDSSCAILTILPGNTPFPVYATQIPVGISSQSLPAISIYPNPVIDQLLISGGFYDSQFRIIDIAGREIDSGYLNGNKINCSSLDPGMYNLQVKTESGWMSSRFVKR